MAQTLERNRTWRENRTKNGCCQRCNGELDTIRSKKYCIRCLTAIQNYSKSRYLTLKAFGKCTKCGEPAIDRGSEQVILCQSCMDKRVEDNKRRRREIKAKVYQAYGGYVCACCGETTPEFLTIDHINGGGSQQRRDLKHTNGGCSNSMYLWLIKNNFPNNFQVLCYNCNAGKYRNGGVCPHKQKETQCLTKETTLTAKLPQNFLLTRRT